MGYVYPDIVENTVVPLYDFFRGTHRRKYGKILDKTQWLSREEVLMIQRDNFKALIKHAYETVPYYRRVFKENKITPDDIKEQKDLTKIPVLTKDDILKNKDDLVSKTIDREKLIPYMSGGTGSQITFYVTKEQLSWELAAEYRIYGWADYRLGDRCLMFWGSPIDMARHKALVKRLTSWIERIKVVNTYVISDEAMGRHVNILREYQPEVIKGYASSVFLVAKHLNENGIEEIRPRTVLTSAEMLFPHYREVIEEAFGCKVFDYYGSREVGAMAAECEEHDGFHVNAENVLVEFIRDGEPVTEGESGLIYVTNLRNYGMPFIRYEIGDVGRPSCGECSCGRGLPMMESLKGRASQFIAILDKKSGKVVPISTADTGVIAVLLMYMPVDSYRIVQESLDKIVIKVVAREGYSQKDTDFIVEYLFQYFDDELKIEVDKVDDLPPLPSGKRSVFISQINAFKTEQSTRARSNNYKK